MKRTFLMLFAVAMMAMIGCAGEEEGGDADSSAPATQVSYPLCEKCGQQSGTDACCAEGAAVCASCGLHDGAPGCCKMEAGQTGVEICACGHIKASELCCKDTAAKCAECGMFEGSPGCCKIDSDIAAKN